MKEKIISFFDKLKTSVQAFWKKFNLKSNPVLISLVIFGFVFLLDLFAIRFFTNTNFVFACLLILIETLLAVLLCNTNYGILGLVAVGELITGFIVKKLLAVVLSLIIYFLALFIIHFIRKQKGAK